MYDYVTKELPVYLMEEFPNIDTTNASLMGHSMGGHGALTIFFKNYNKYKSVSAFSPICNPINCPWGKKAFGGYLGEFPCPARPARPSAHRPLTSVARLSETKCSLIVK